MSVSKAGRRREPRTAPSIEAKGIMPDCYKVRVIDHRPAINGARLIRVIHRKTIKLSLCARARAFREVRDEFEKTEVPKLQITPISEGIVEIHGNCR